MEYQYKFGVGGIEEVCKGRVDKEESLDSLDLNESQGIIIVPKLIGVYQEFKEKDGIQDFTETFDQLGILMDTGEMENLDPSLICLAYDPTIMNKSLVEKSVCGDKIKRLKYIDSLNLPDLPDFYEKNPPSNFIFNKGFRDLNSGKTNENNIALLRRNKDILERLREDYGLTRYESVDLVITNHILMELEGKKLISNPFLLKLGKKIIDLDNKD